MYLASNANVSYKRGVHQLETTKEEERPGSIARSCDNWGSTFMICYTVILKGLNGYQTSTNAIGLLGELNWTLVYTNSFTTERWEQTGESAQWGW